MSLKYYGRKVYDKRNGQICRPQKCRVKFGKNIFAVFKSFTNVSGPMENSFDISEKF